MGHSLRGAEGMGDWWATLSLLSRHTAAEWQLWMVLEFRLWFMRHFFFFNSKENRIKKKTSEFQMEIKGCAELR